MDYTKFYTPPDIACLLLKQLNIASPNTIVDICCGSYNLLYSAKERWKNAELIGVDIIPHSSPDIKCIQSDGRKYALSHPKSFSLVLANPPFDNVVTKNEYPKLYSNLPDYCHTTRLEVEMLFANLKLLNDGGTLLIIMPSTFITSEKNIKFRKYLALHYHIQQIYRLPDETFGSKRISTYALVIRNVMPNKKRTTMNTIKKYDGDYYIDEKILQPRNLMIKGEWDNSFTNNSIDFHFDFRRGNISSNLFTNNGFPILHTSKSSDNWKPSVRYINPGTVPNVFAENGDILISRIGKSAGQWCIYYGQKIPISDCLYRIKDPNGIIASKLQDQKNSPPPKGVATRYITMKDFYNWYLTLSNI